MRTRVKSLSLQEPIVTAVALVGHNLRLTYSNAAVVNTDIIEVIEENMTPLDSYIAKAIGQGISNSPSVNNAGKKTKGDIRTDNTGKVEMFDDDYSIVWWQLYPIVTP